MRKFLLVAIGALVVGSASAQAPQGYHKFTDTRTVQSAVNDENHSTTSWSSALALFESELQRTGKGTYDLSSMWVARHMYFEKVWKYVRMRGTINLSAGGTWEDVPNVIRKYGIVPAEAYSGVSNTLNSLDYLRLDGVAKGYADAVISGRMLLSSFLDGLNNILDAYFGRVPETFTYGGVRYSPESFRDMLGLNMDDYVCFTSFTHHPFYTWFAIEIPDNWAWGQAFNLPQEEMLNVTTGALNRGYAVWWGADLGNDDEIYMRGVSMNSPQPDQPNSAELAKWVSVGTSQRAAVISRYLEGPINGREYTQAERQLAFDSYETSDDHGMLLTGLSKDQDGGNYFKVKNSWGDDEGAYSGYFYASYPWFKYKTLEVAMHKDALPRDLKVRLGYIAR